jgi:hypothetical protein
MWGVRGRRGSAIESGCAAVCQLRCIALHANNVTSKHPPTHPRVEVSCQAVLRVVGQLQRLCR